MIEPRLKQALKEAAIANNISYEDARIAYESMCMFIRDKIADIDIDSYNSKEEFDKIRASFVIPEVGKLNIRWEVVEKIREVKRKKNEKN
jgi:hypothetical protein